ncbi:MAG: O-antigen ligase family protein [Thermoguttaceae bacterium]|nr:O-antigen ligase family protein [Thermoguttaceae bacterium]
MDSMRFTANTNGIEKYLPIYCALIVYKTVFNYFIFLAPPLAPLWMLLYNLVTLFGLVVYIPLAWRAFANPRYRRWLWPALAIPTCVLINIAAAIVETGDFSLLSRNFRLPHAWGTQDEYGYYFSQINTWFGNISVVLIICLFATTFETIKKCVLAILLTLFVPAFLTVVTHPGMLGVREGVMEAGNNEVFFGGGLWNIGVMGVGSVSWLALSMVKNMSKGQRRFVVFSVAFFAFLGIAGLSRTLITMLVLSGGYYFLKARKNNNWFINVILVLLLSVAFIILAWDLVAAILFRFSDKTSGTQNVRLFLWQSYLSYFDEVWLAGASFGNVYKYWNEISWNGDHFMPHSSVVNFLVRFGLLCAISYLILIKRAFLTIKESARITRDQTACIRAGGIAYILLAFMNQTGYAEPIFYLMFGLLLAYSQIVKKEEAAL